MRWTSMGRGAAARGISATTGVDGGEEHDETEEEENVAVELPQWMPFVGSELFLAVTPASVSASASAPTLAPVSWPSAEEEDSVVEEKLKGEERGEASFLAVAVRRARFEVDEDGSVQCVFLPALPFAGIILLLLLLMANEGEGVRGAGARLASTTLLPWLPILLGESARLMAGSDGDACTSSKLSTEEPAGVRPTSLSCRSSTAGFWNETLLRRLYAAADGDSTLLVALEARWARLRSDWLLGMAAGAVVEAVLCRISSSSRSSSPAATTMASGGEEK